MNPSVAPHAIFSGSLSGTLGAIEFAQLIRRTDESDQAFLFKHALVQDTVYASLMRQDRRRLHRYVGEVMEEEAPSKLRELAPLLAHHFGEAGELERSLHYLQLAGETAAARFANQEALSFFSSALDVAEELHAPQCAALALARGQIYERIGNFERARSDLEQALQFAKHRRDEQIEWQSLMDLGYTWSARDYSTAGMYFERALDLARESGDLSQLAHSLNRVGNWYTNSEEPEQALRHHQEALAAFQSQFNDRGLAETEDLLSMAQLLGGNLIAGVEHFDHSLALYEKLGDRQGIASTLMSSHLFYPWLPNDTVVLPPPPGDLDADYERTKQLNRELGWRAGEAYDAMVVGGVHATRGEYDRGLALLGQSLAIAREIDHRQWITAATTLLGGVHAELLDYPNAQDMLVDAVLHARAIDSAHWIGAASSLLVSTYIALGDLARAQEVLDTVLKPETLARTLGKRRAWAAKAELALARNEPIIALEALDRLMQASFNLDRGAVIPLLWMMRAEAYMQLERYGEAEPLLESALAGAADQVRRPRLWRIHRLLAVLYHKQGRTDQSIAQKEMARAIVAELANTIKDGNLREHFLRAARERIENDGGAD
jgi:tetratricopeptide (TPR) repeat protein